MKRVVIIITALMLLPGSAFTQRNPGERFRQEAQNQKRTTVRQPAQSRRPNRDIKSQTPSGESVRVRNNQPELLKNKHLRMNYTPQGRQRVRQRSEAVRTYTPVRYNKVRINYKAPKINVTWTRGMYRDYRRMYPDFNHWYYPLGYRILTIPAYNAYRYLGEVSNVYGRVFEVWYSRSTDEYFLYFGNAFAYEDFTVVISGNHARRFSRFPERYFTGRTIWITGLVSTFGGRPEIMVRRKSQVHLY